LEHVLAEARHKITALKHAGNEQKQQITALQVGLQASVLPVSSMHTIGLANSQVQQGLPGRWSLSEEPHILVHEKRQLFLGFFLLDSTQDWCPVLMQNSVSCSDRAWHRLSAVLQAPAPRSCRGIHGYQGRGGRGSDSCRQCSSVVLCH